MALNVSTLFAVKSINRIITNFIGEKSIPRADTSECRAGFLYGLKKPEQPGF